MRIVMGRDKSSKGTLDAESLVCMQVITLGFCKGYLSVLQKLEVWAS